MSDLDKIKTALFAKGAILVLYFSGVLLGSLIVAVMVNWFIGGIGIIIHLTIIATVAVKSNKAKLFGLVLFFMAWLGNSCYLLFKSLTDDIWFSKGLFVPFLLYSVFGIPLLYLFTCYYTKYTKILNFNDSGTILEGNGENNTIERKHRIIIRSYFEPDNCSTSSASSIAESDKTL